MLRNSLDPNWDFLPDPGSLNVGLKHCQQQYKTKKIITILLYADFFIFTVPVPIEYFNLLLAGSVQIHDTAIRLIQ